MGQCCSTVKKERQVNMRPAFVRMQRQVTVIDTNPIYISYSPLTPPPPPTPTLSFINETDSDISCNFSYEDEFINLNTLIASSLIILLFSLRESYDICVICTENVASLTLNSCFHTILCTNCYNYFCNSDINTCPVCRKKIDFDNPFIY